MTPLVLMFVRLLSTWGLAVDVCADRSVVIGARCALPVTAASHAREADESRAAPLPPPPPSSRFDLEPTSISNGF